MTGIHPKDAPRPAILVTVPTYYPGFKGGGPPRSVASIVDGMAHRGSVCLVTRDRDFGDAQAYPGLSGTIVQRGKARVLYLNPRSLRQMLRALRAGATTHYDVVYLNSFWNPAFSIVPLWLARLRLLRATTFLIAPRGELSPGALHISGTKKRVVLAVMRRVIRSLDLTWHASSDREAAEIRAVFPRAQTIVSLNPTELPHSAISPHKTDRVDLSAVFVSRVSRKKNLLGILRSLRLVKCPVHLDVYGPIEDDGYWAECALQIQELAPTIEVRYCGILPPSQVRETFARYECFIFPTMGENFGHVIAESLSASCPVICTDTTPWTKTLRAGGGIVVEDNDEALAHAIEGIAMGSADDRMMARREAGRAFENWVAGRQNTNVLDVVLSQWGHQTGRHA